MFLLCSSLCFSSLRSGSIRAPRFRFYFVRFVRSATRRNGNIYVISSCHYSERCLIRNRFDRAKTQVEEREPPRNRMISFCALRLESAQPLLRDHFAFFSSTILFPFSWLSQSFAECAHHAMARSAIILVSCRRRRRPGRTDLERSVSCIEGDPFKSAQKAENHSLALPHYARCQFGFQVNIMRYLHFLSNAHSEIAFLVSCTFHVNKSLR